MRSRNRKDRGAVILLVALLIFVLIGIAALAVDLGQLHLARARAQHVCDASALGAAWYLEPSNAGISTDVASKTADRLAVANNELDKRTVLDPVDGTEGVSLELVDSRSVKVEGRVNIEFGFAKILGFNSSTVRVSATARLDGSTGFTYAFLPLAVDKNKVYLAADPDSVIDPLPQRLSTPFWEIATGKSGNPNNLYPIVFPGDSYDPTAYENLLMGQGTELDLNKGSRVTTITNDVVSSIVDTLTGRILGDTWTWQTWNNATDKDKVTSKRIVVLPVTEKNANGTFSVVGFTGFYVQEVKRYVDPNKYIPARHCADLYGYFVPGIVGSKSVRWLKPFPPDQPNLMYRVRLTR